MKKLFIILLMLSVTVGVFAQITVSGGVELDFGAGLTFEPKNVEPEWYWNILSTGTFIKAAYEGDRISSWVRLSGSQQDIGGLGLFILPSLDLTADATVTMGPVDLSVGRDWMPWVRWSSMDFWGDNNWDCGASAAKDIYIQAKFFGAYLGINEAGLINGAASGDQSSPGFYVGYDYEVEDVFSVGAAFAGVPRTERAIRNIYSPVVVTDGKFPFMINIFGKLFNLGPASLGLNLGFYGSPSHADSLFCIAAGRFDDIVSGPEAMVLEAMIDLGLDFEPVFIGFSVGMLANFKGDKNLSGDYTKNTALQLGLNAIIDINNTGFSIIPGLFYWNKFFEVKSRNSSGMDLGVSFMYSF